ncbi:MAG: hypothetical protein ACT4QF_01705 [Sporichthyaceae bacterium]
MGDPDRPEATPGDRPTARPPTPRWVKATLALVVAIVLVLLATAILGGEHGPGRHGLGAGDAAPIGPRSTVFA